jgi:hypothetical protein
MKNTEPNGANAAVDASQKYPVRTLAEMTGNVAKMKNRASFLPDVRYTPQHAAAAFLHGWLAHEKATSVEFELTLADYELALVAAHSTCSPHPGALSKYAMPVSPGATPEVTR